MDRQQLEDDTINLGPVVVAQAMGELESLPRVSLCPIYLLA